EEIFRLLYEEARINKLTKGEMETYNRSVLEYYDVREAIDLAKKEGEEIGEKRGEKHGIERERIRLIKSCRRANLSIKQIAEVTGLTEGQIYNILDD
ncbi:MAG: hypothetical protein LBO71_08105, partial [Prevotellaceae bacterium]|nr:hypothetical protein [Prevotellaceae bacterium]